MLLQDGERLSQSLVLICYLFELSLRCEDNQKNCQKLINYSVNFGLCFTFVAQGYSDKIHLAFYW